MTRKTVPFKMPPKEARQLIEGLQKEFTPIERPRTTPNPEPRSGGDKWVMRVEASRPAEPRAGAAKAFVPATSDSKRFMVDLSADRNWFELVQLIYAFPYLAVWCWTWSTVAKSLGAFGQK